MENRIHVPELPLKQQLVRPICYSAIPTMNETRNVVVVKWSVCSPSNPMIQVRIPRRLHLFSVKFVIEKNENKQQEAWVGPLFNNE